MSELMPLFGAHMSVAGGYHHALLAAQRQRCDTVQLFTKSPNQWKAKELSVDDCRQFRLVQKQTGIKPAIAHDSYLINLASPDEQLYRRSIDAFSDEVVRADRLGLRFLVTHPGAHLGAGEAAGLARVAAALNEVFQRQPQVKVKVLLETTAGQGTSLGYRFAHLAGILSQVSEPRRFGVCLDTCHVFAAGYALSPELEYRRTMQEFDEVIGLRWLKVFHVNDSVKAWGSRVDRHAHIGQGQLGIEPFRLLVNDPRFAVHPMILETPKEGSNGEDWDAMNLQVLRRLVRKR